MSAKRKLWIAVLLGFLAFALVLVTLDDPGVTWDEPRSFKASRGYMAWLGILRRAVWEGHIERAFDDAAIVRWWVQDPTLELHPPVPKLAVGLGWGLLRNTWGNIAAYRFSAAVWFGVLVALVYITVVGAYRPLAGLFASLCLLCMPRMFLHAHLANLDVPMATTWVFGMYTYWRAIARPAQPVAGGGVSPSIPPDPELRSEYQIRRGGASSGRGITRRAWTWTVLAGLAFGIALGTKLNAFLMPLVWGSWLLFWQRERVTWIKTVLIGAMGLVVFLAIWPWLYHDTLARLAYYVSMGYRFGQTVQYYLGHTGRVPWHYPLVLTIAVVPTTITAAYFVGIVRVLKPIRGERDGESSQSLAAAHLATAPRKQSAGGESAEQGTGQRLGYYILLNALIPLLIAVLGLQALYSGERHFMPVFPYLAMLAGIGFAAVFEAVERRLPSGSRRGGIRLRRLLVVGLAIVLLGPPVLSMIKIHPYELSYYSEIVGGLPGAVRLGLETTFWCESYKACLPYLNANTPEGALIWVDQPLALRAYQDDKLLRQDLRITGWDVVSPYTCDYAVVEMRETGFTNVPELVDLMKQYQPEFTVSVEGVPLAMVYKLR
jgi:4-amino-4-deoxy-L-arabinose transferase-like glycosyltransferase